MIRTRGISLLAAAACALLALGIRVAVAQNVTLDDLKIRAEAGDRSATRQLAEAYERRPRWA